MFEWQDLLLYSYNGFSISPAGILLTFFVISLIARRIKGQKVKLPLQRPSREPYNPDTFRK